MSLGSKQSSLFSFYALHSGGKLKGAMVHCYFVPRVCKEINWFAIRTHKKNANY